MENQSTPKFITDLIEQSNVAYMNKLTPQECNELATEIEIWLKQKAVSIEGLFNPDSDEQLMAIPLNSLGS